MLCDNNLILELPNTGKGFVKKSENKDSNVDKYFASAEWRGVYLHFVSFLQILERNINFVLALLQKHFSLLLLHTLTMQKCYEIFEMSGKLTLS